MLDDASCRGIKQVQDSAMDLPRADYRERITEIISINDLSPELDIWSIKASVFAKGGKQEYNNKNGKGIWFSFDMIDKDGGEIRVTCYNEHAYKFFETISVGRMYLIRNGKLKEVNRIFNALKSNWEIIMQHNSAIVPLEDNSFELERKVAQLEVKNKELLKNLEEANKLNKQLQRNLEETTAQHSAKPNSGHDQLGPFSIFSTLCRCIGYS